MRIFFDHQTFSLLNYGGIPRYYAELIAGINHNNNVEAYLPPLISNNIHLREAGISAYPFFPEIKIPKKIPITYFLNEIQTIRKLQQEPYDIFHATYYDPYFLPYLKKRPFVITYLDMIHEIFGPQFIELGDYRRITEQKHLLANSADRIIAISENTKKDIVDILNINPAKIDVIYLGNSLIPKINQSSSYLHKMPYFLFVGNRSMYKNFAGLLKSIYLLLKKHKIKLLCAGGGAFSKAEKALICSLKATDIVEQCSIDDKVLPILYQNAIAFVFPSLYEGFGIPILEAFACGCPCIVSHTSSLPEVAGDAALYFDPLDSESMSYALEQLIINDTLRTELIQRGRQRLTLFSWKATVGQTIDLYANIM